MPDYNISFDETAEEAIINLLKKDGVVYRNEFRYRLEKPSPYSEQEDKLLHGVISRKLDDLEERKIIQTTDLRGRRRKDSALKPLLFYRLKESGYTTAIQDLIKVKRDCSQFLSGISSYAGFYAQGLWKKALDKRNITVLAEDVNDFEGNETSSKRDIDLLIEYKGCNFGIEVKNTFSYPKDIKNKYRIAAELDVVPIIVARTLSYGDRKYITSYGGLIKLYEVAIFPDICKKKMNEIVQYLKYPLMIIDEIDDHVVDNLVSRLDYGVARYDYLLNKVRNQLEYLENNG